MSFYDDGSADSPVTRAEFDALRSQLHELRSESAARSTIDEAELINQLNQADSPEAVRDLVTATNREYATALLGADAIEGVDV